MEQVQALLSLGCCGIGDVIIIIIIIATIIRLV